MKLEIVPRCAHDLPNGFAFGIAAVAAGQWLEVTENGMTTKYQPNSANPYAKIAHGTEVVEPEYDSQGNCPSLCSRLAKWLRFEDTAIAVKQWLHDATRKLTQAPPSEPSGYAQRDTLSVSRLTSVARFTWDADIHLMSVTAQGSPQSSPHSPSEEPGTAGAAGRGATGSVASGQARSLPYLSQYNAVDEAPSKTTTTRFLYDALHRRLGRVKDNGETTVFVYEGWNVIAEKTVRLALSGEGDNFKHETRHVWGEDLSGSLQGAGGIGGLLRSVNTTANRELRTRFTMTATATSSCSPTPKAENPPATPTTPLGRR
jgi:hypothetical protein